MWTDTMPVKGKCPAVRCEWTYDVHKELKKSITQREDEARQIIRCPQCHEPIVSRLTLCEHCGEIIIGSRSFNKKYLFIVVAVLLILLSLIVKYW
jgi:ribosomal protein L37AE/L43A